MPANPLALDIITDLRARLATISVANGFHTDAGARVLHGRFHKDIPTLHLAIFAGQSTEVEDRARTRVECRLVVEIAAAIPIPASDTGGDVVEKVVADIQTAIETAKRNLSGLASNITPLGRGKTAPIDGDPHEYAFLSYAVTYTRAYGRPDLRAA